MTSEFEAKTRASQLSAVRDPHDGKAWAAFQKLYEGPIQRWALTMGLSPNDAQELTQDVLIKLNEEMPTFIYDPKKKFRGWLRRVVSTTVADRWRDRKRRPGDWGTGDSAAHEALQQVADKDGSGIDGLLEALEDRLERDRLVREACEKVKGQVNDRTWRAFWMTTVDEVKAAEVAATLGLTVAAVYMGKKRVLGMIKDGVGRARGRAD